ncbi:MAG: ABC transporter ATP-binding protein [Candidatus Phytoplasma sp.]|nr:ABC transporter ATP-binding protein [Phytoplasma sp.]
MQRLKNLFKLLKGHYGLFVISVIFVVLHRLTYSYVPLFTQYLIEVLENSGHAATSEVNLPNFILNFLKNYQTEIQIAIVISLMLLTWQTGRFIMLFFEAKVKGKLLENVAQDLRLDLYDHIQNLDYHFHNNVDSGDLIQRVTSDVDKTTTFVSQRALESVSLISAVIFGSYQMYHVNPTIMWVTLAVIPISATASIIYFINIDKVFKKVEEKEAEVMVVIQENVSASRVVKAFANEAYEVEKLDQKNKTYRDMDIKAGKLVALYWGGMDTLMMIQFLIVILLGIYFASTGAMSIASVSSALMLVGLLIWPIRGLGRLINDFGKALVASDRLTHLFEQKSEYENDGTQTPVINGKIEFKNVYFKYPEAEDYILEDISFTIEPGETVAFIGKTGSGKTTLINLLLRMYEYQGSIKIDGVELKDIKKSHIRKNIGTVLQDPFLYSKTVYENIAIANKLVEDKQIYQAAEIAALQKDINTFQKGYDTIVGEQGTTLSGGQKQRVAIARILVAQKPILIFDDALSALDNKTDLAIRRSLNNQDTKKTTLIITHRITTAKEADKIVVLHQGRVQMVGKHQELSKKEGLYQTLWNIQGALEEEFMKMIEEEVAHG